MPGSSTTPGVKKSSTKKPDDSDPLKGLAVAVDLPAIKPTGKWLALGKVSIPDKLIVLMSLRGEDCLGPGKKVGLKERDNRSWQCLATERAGAEATEIALFRIENQQLQFAWSEGAERVANAGALKNASFEIAVAASKKMVGLRKTIKGSPMAISLIEQTSAVVEIPDPPKLDTIRIEVDMPSAELKTKRVSWRLLGDGPALKANGLLWAEAIRPPRLLIKLESSFNKSLRITATPMFWIADREKPQRLTAKGLAEAVIQLNAYEAKLNLARSSLPKTKPTSEAVKAQADVITKELAGVRKAADDLTSLQEFAKEVKLGKMNLRVVQLLDGYTVTLLSTK